MAKQPSRHREVERKYDVTDATIAPSFAGLSLVARVEPLPTYTLDAQYHDTARGDLRRHRITLRRRTGGPDEGWHLKLPAGGDARTELRAGLGADDDAIPAELLDVVLAIVRDHPLAIVARITTVRTVSLLYGEDGALVAEFSDDQVSAWSAGSSEQPGEQQQWREWELELSDRAAADTGSATLLDRLGNRLADAGAVPAGSGSKLARVLDDAAAPEPGGLDGSTDPVHRAVAEHVAELLVWDRAVREDADDAVHQLRVTTRKIRSLIKGAEASFGLTADAWVLDELRELAAVLGIARDAEVLAARYTDALAALPPELIRGDVTERLVEGAHRRYRAGLRKSLAAMRSPRYFRLLDALEGLSAAEPTGDDTAQGGGGVAKAYAKVRKQVRAVDAAEPEDRDEALHAIRKGAKRLRYTASATGAKKVAEAAKDVQTLLGDHQDSVVARAELGRQAFAAYAAGADTFTYGLLFQREDDAAQAAEAGLDDALRRLKRAAKKA